ncbi:MAG TPA: aminomethyl-transferring glycine dehydrogenase [Xanthobacteraceae bacterium]|jgi:glycine dehydrogenase
MRDRTFVQVLEENGFAARHIGVSAADLPEMLNAIGAASLDQLIAETVPKDLRQREALDLGGALSEHEALHKLRSIAGKNKVLISMIGQGYYGTITPAVIARNILDNPAWYTAYTPYQSEISQGRLEALLNFQTMIADLTGLEIANASLLDEATAAAEAMAMARRVARSQGQAFFVDRDCLPQTIAVVRTRAAPLGWRIIVGDPFIDLDPNAVFGALLQYPGCSGEIRDFRPAIAALHSAAAVAVMAADPLALTLITPPGELGADIAVGSTQRFGVPMGYGGPHAAYIATRPAYQRSLPGRLVGVSVDSRGRPAYRLALQTREQHIRREKATSNICTAQVLLAVMASMYAVYHGPEGLKKIARRVHHSASTLAGGLKALGWTVAPGHFFDTITVGVGERQDQIQRRAVENGINLRRIATTDGERCIGMSCDETTTPAVIEAVWRSFGSFAGGRAAAEISCASLARQDFDALPAALQRQSAFLTHPVFHRHRSETEMLRYMRRLAGRDLALDRSMIPLGSCTMKLNATAEMIPLSWPEFSGLHPFAPADQAQGYAEMIADLSAKLCAITGFDAVSLQPNSGAQGEYAGLLAIRAYHSSKGEPQRNVCLIPSSAHGTNPASAHMAGMEVVVVGCNARGDVDLADLRAKAEKHTQNLAVLMITYPSTHGVFEPQIRAMCDIVHRCGGQVYLDGANLNAQVGLARPGDYGADVSHINLHKTFCIPHGGGGPGVGPIGVKVHLVPFLPGRGDASAEDRGGGPARVGPVAAAPFGSASILSISWMYIALMGGEGLTAATAAAILNANYIAARLEPHYPLLFTGAHGRVAHECILDTRPLKEAAGVSVEDIAKRLIDYGFHAPTMSFPVAGTLMIEPTESESRSELDRFCDAMISIRNEIRAIEDGRMPRESNPLRNAPHSVLDLADEKWDRPYTRAQACFPVQALEADKYWCPVNRVDNVYGDRNLFCSCPPVADLQEAAE